MSKNKVRLDAINFLSQFGENIKSKFSNICSKTGQYNIPTELFQKRTSRSNRVLIEWKVVKKNRLTYEQLKTFYGGVVVEFVNNDYFDSDNYSNPLFNVLKEKLGTDELVSAIISIRSESGSSSSQIQRDSFEKLINNTRVNYKGTEITITEQNYMNYAITQIKKGSIGVGIGNEWWAGFLYISIKGGQQDTRETHHDKELTLFNPACEYANEDVCFDIDMVMIYFAFLSIQKDMLDANQEIIYFTLKERIENILSSSTYDSPAYKGNLYDYCQHHPSCMMFRGSLTDPIQVKQILISNFNIKDRKSESIDFTHGEAVYYQKYYWDKEKMCILSPARPTNVFWSYHLSNMMQQDFSLEDYFDYEEKRYLKRQKLLSHN